MSKSWIAALALALALPAGGHAASMAAATRTAVRVPVRGLDLDQPAGAARMLRRLDEAAMEACGASPFSWSEYRWAVRRSECHAASLDRAVAELDAPAVTALYDQTRDQAS